MFFKKAIIVFVITSFMLSTGYTLWSVFKSHRPKSISKIGAFIDAERCIPISTNTILPSGFLHRYHQPLAIKNILQRKNSVLIYYRGIWSKECKEYFDYMVKNFTKINHKQTQWIIISRDKETYRQSISKLYPSFQFFSDPGLAWAIKLGIVFEIDNSIVNQYATKGIEIKKILGKKRRQFTSYPSRFFSRRKLKSGLCLCLSRL